MTNPALTTINDLGRMAGCSITTVSRVLNNSGAVSNHKREAVLRAIRETNFYVNRPRKGGRHVRNKTVSDVIEIIQHRHSPVERLSLQHGELAVSSLQPPWSGEDPTAPSWGIDNAFHRGIMDGAIEELSKWGYRAHLRFNNNLLDPALLSELNDSDRGGILLVGEYSDDLTQFVRGCRRPVVLTDVLATGQADVVTTDNEYGISQAFKHVYDLGHRRIGFGSVIRTHERSAERYIAYKLNMVERGLALRPDWVFGSNDHIQEVSDEAERVLKLPDRPTAILCQNDCCALGVARAANRLGISIPNQLSVVGFDDVDFASLVTPPLTTVRVSVQEMGRQAVRQLMVQVKGGPTNRARGCHVRLLPELIVRESTAAAPSSV